MTALTGIRVIELSREPIAFVGKLCGDMGADVVLVEPPGGDPCRGYPPFLDDTPGEDRSLYWWHYNSSKRSVVIDLDEEGGRDRFLALVATADVLIEGEPPGRLSALGLDYDDLVAHRADLIHVSVTPFGRNDPKSDLPATDLTLLAGGGPMWSCGYDDHSLPPVRGPQQGYQTAANFAFLSALTALAYRGVSGEGQFIDVSQHAALNVTTEGSSIRWLTAQSTVQRQTGRHASVTPTTKTSQLCSDGRLASTGAGARNQKQFARLHEWLKELGLESQLPEAVFLEMGANWEGLLNMGLIGEDDAVTAIFGAGREAMKLIASTLTAQDFFVQSQRNGFTSAVVNAPEETFEDEHFKARGFHVDVHHEDIGRTITYPGAPYPLPASPWRISRRAPKLGEHDEEVFSELT